MSSLVCKALCIIINFLVLWSISRIVPSIIIIIIIIIIISFIIYGHFLNSINLFLFYFILFLLLSVYIYIQSLHVILMKHMNKVTAQVSKIFWHEFIWYFCYFVGPLFNVLKHYVCKMCTKLSDPSESFIDVNLKILNIGIKSESVRLSIAHTYNVISILVWIAARIYIYTTATRNNGFCFLSYELATTEHGQNNTEPQATSQCLICWRSQRVHFTHSLSYSPFKTRLNSLAT